MVIGTRSAAAAASEEKPGLKTFHSAAEDLLTQGRERSPLEKELHREAEMKRLRLAELEKHEVPAMPAGSTGPAPIKAFAQMNLDEKMIHMFENMATKNDVQGINTKVDLIETEISQIKASMVTHTVFNSEIDTLKGRIQAIENDSGSSSMAVDAGGSSSTIPTAILERLAKVELDLKTNTEDVSDRDITAILGGFTEADTIDEAGKWINEQLWWNNGPQPTQHYCKGDWKGFIFIKFQTKRDRDAAVTLFRNFKLKFGSKDIWAKADLPIEKRVQESVLYGVKKLFISWGYEKLAIWIDNEKHTIQIGSDIFFQMSIKDKKLDFKIEDGWGEHFKAPELQKIIEDGNEKLAKASITATKGLGKGKNKSKAD